MTRWHAALQRVVFLAWLVGAAATACASHPAFGAPLTTPPEHRRTPDQTFLTFPEWYLVHSPAEYASYLATGAAPSAFQLFAHIGQFWQGYAAVNKEAARYPFNSGYHLMVLVIGASTTVEYCLKGIYEHTVGRLAEAITSDPAMVPEERFAARYAQDYVTFIRVEPWYKFDFWRQLTRLWIDAPVRGPDLLRRWERRFALTTELLVKEGYARLIKLGTGQIYDPPKPVTAVVLSKMPELDPVRYPDFVALQSSGSEVLATVPRYEAFTAYVRWLAAQDIAIKEIAGNDGEVLTSVLVPTSWLAANSARVLFEQPIITVPGRKRVVLAVEIARLGTFVRGFDGGESAVEHVYDF